MKGGRKVCPLGQLKRQLQVVGLKLVHLILSGGFSVFELFVKKVSGLSGEKVTICDNLASHFSPSVNSACNEVEII